MKRLGRKQAIEARREALTPEIRALGNRELYNLVRELEADCGSDSGVNDWIRLDVAAAELERRLTECGFLE